MVIYLSLSVISDELNATISPPEWIFPSTPSPPCSNYNAPVSLLDEFVLFKTPSTSALASTTTLLFEESNNVKSPDAVSIVVPLVKPRVSYLPLYYQQHLIEFHRKQSWQMLWL